MVEEGEVNEVEIKDTYIALTPKNNEKQNFIKQYVWNIVGLVGSFVWSRCYVFTSHSSGKFAIIEFYFNLDFSTHYLSSNW